MIRGTVSAEIWVFFNFFLRGGYFDTPCTCLVHSDEPSLVYCLLYWLYDCIVCHNLFSYHTITKCLANRALRYCTIPVRSISYAIHHQRIANSIWWIILFDFIRKKITKILRKKEINKNINMEILFTFKLCMTLLSINFLYKNLLGPIYITICKILV